MRIFFHLDFNSISIFSFFIQMVFTAKKKRSNILRWGGYTPGDSVKWGRGLSGLSGLIWKV